MMIVLFVHGMGRTPLSGVPMLWWLRKSGLKTSTFGYTTLFADFNVIKSRLVKRLVNIAQKDEYVVVGHSLGGVLLRAAINSLPDDVNRPRHVFLLGSPIQASRIAKLLRENICFRIFSGNCGQLLASDVRMRKISFMTDRVTSIVGVRGIRYTKNLFGDELNDGIVSCSEASANWISDQIPVPIIHTLLPSDRRVAGIISAELQNARQ